MEIAELHHFFSHQALRQSDQRKGPAHPLHPVRLNLPGIGSGDQASAPSIQDTSEKDVWPSDDWTSTTLDATWNHPPTALAWSASSSGSRLSPLAFLSQKGNQVCHVLEGHPFFQTFRHQGLLTTAQRVNPFSCDTMKTPIDGLQGNAGSCLGDHHAIKFCAILQFAEIGLIARLHIPAGI